jgi:hypothetical protein
VEFHYQEQVKSPHESEMRVSSSALVMNVFYIDLYFIFVAPQQGPNQNQSQQPQAPVGGQAPQQQPTKPVQTANAPHEGGAMPAGGKTPAEGGKVGEGAKAGEGAGGTKPAAEKGKAGEAAGAHTPATDGAKAGEGAGGQKEGKGEEGGKMKETMKNKNDAGAGPFAANSGNAVVPRMLLSATCVLISSLLFLL